MGLLVANVGPVKQPGRVKQWVGRTARQITYPWRVQAHATRQQAREAYDQLFSPRVPLDVSALARKVDRPEEQSFLKSATPDLGVVVSSGLLSMASAVGVGMLTGIDPTTQGSFAYLVGAVALSSPPLAYLKKRVKDVLNIGSQHHVDHLMRVLFVKSGSENIPKAAEIAYVRGVLTQPGHEDIKKEFINELIDRRTISAHANEYLPLAIVALYDLFDEQQKEELLSFESGKSHSLQSFGYHSSLFGFIFKMLTDKYAFTGYYLGLNDLVKRNLQSIVKELSVFQSSGHDASEKRLLKDKFSLDGFNIDLIVASLLQNPNFDQDKMIETIANKARVISLLPMLDEEQGIGLFSIVNNFLQSLKDLGVELGPLQKLGQLLFQKMAKAVIKDIWTLHEEPAEQIPEIVGYLIEIEAQLRTLLEVDAKTPPFLATELFEGLAEHFVKGKVVDFESGVVFIQEYLLAHLNYVAQHEEAFPYFYIEQNLLDWLDSTQVRYEMRAFMVHMVTSIQNDHFNGRIYNEIVQKVDVKYWREVLLPLYSVNQAFYSRMMNAKVFHPDNAFINILYKETLIYNFINQLAQASPGDVVSLIRSNSEFITDRRPENVVAALIQAYQSGSLSLERAVQVLKDSSSLKLSFKQRIEHSMKIAHPVGEGAMKIAAALDPLTYTVFLMDAFPQYNHISAPYYNSAGVLDKIARLASDVKHPDRDKFAAILLGGSLNFSLVNHAEALFTYANCLAQQYFYYASNFPVFQNQDRIRHQLAQELVRLINFIKDEHRIIYGRSVNTSEYKLIDILLMRTNLKDLDLELSLAQYLSFRNRPDYEAMLRRKLSQLKHKKIKLGADSPALLGILIDRYETLLV